MSKIEEWVRSQFRKGLSEERIYDSLLQNGYDEETAKKAIQRVENRINDGQKGSISGIDLSGDEFFVKQNLVRNKYEVFDSQDKVVLRAKQKLFKMKEEFPFKDSEGNVVFTVKAQSILDFAGDYTLIDKTRDGDEVISVLQKDFTFFRHSWKIKDKNGQVMAKITSRGMITDVLRHLSSIFNIFPMKYTIEAQNGEKLGEIEEKFSLKDKYWVRINKTENIPKETLVASSIAIDALEGH